MTKKEAISIISKCAALYAVNLCDKQLAFVYQDGNNQIGFVEVIFRSNNFIQVLQSIMNIYFSARMIGDYTGTHLELYTEKVAGTTTVCLGLIPHGGGYIPNTILKEDIRNIIPKPPGKIFAIFRKPIRQDTYTELTFRSRSIDITKKCIPHDLLKKVDMSLFIPETKS